MVRWYCYELGYCPQHLLQVLWRIPGLSIKNKGQQIFAPSNAAWMVEELCREAGVAFHVRDTTTVPKIVRDSALENRGLREWVPGFLTSYQKEGLAAMSGRSGVFFWAAGCLSGDTEVVVNRAGKAVRMKMRDLVRKFNGEADRGRVWDGSIPTYVQSFDEHEGVIVKNQVTAAVYSGIKRTFTVALDNGQSIRATADHRFLTPVGWKKLSELAVGDYALVESWPDASGKKPKKTRYVYVDHMWNHPHAVRKVWGRKDRAEGALRRTAQVALHRLIAEARLNHVSLEEWVGRVVLNRAELAEFLPPSMHVHHIDGDSLNNNELNLKIMSAELHHKLHSEEGAWKRVLAKVTPVRIDRIDPFGMEETFDLSMEAPHHNFVANGIVVHNSGKTLGAIAWALEYRGPTVVATRASVRRSYGREIERFTHHKAYVIEDTEPLDLDDLEQYRFVVLGWETLPYHVETLIKWKPTAFVLDECFPVGTQVHTDRGVVAIETILPNDRVLSVDAQGQECYQPVRRVIAKKTRKALIRVVHAAGAFTCTPNHKVWTLEDGYVEAENLTPRHSLRVVPEGTGHPDDSSWESSPILQPIVLRPMANLTAKDTGDSSGVGKEGRSSVGRAESSVAGDGVSGIGTGTDAGQQSNGGPIDCGAGRHQEAGAPVSGAPWWQRSATFGTSLYDLSLVSIAGRRVLRGYLLDRETGQWGSAVLTRPSGPGYEAGNRGGWSVTSKPTGPGAGYTQGCNPVFSRVVGIESVERGCSGTPDGDTRTDSVVFDLEVDDTHRYFADGVLVSNCHKVKSNKRFQAIPGEDGKLTFKSRDNIAYDAMQLSRAVQYRLATTATPIKDRVRDLWAQLDLVEPNAWGPFYRDNTASFTERYCGACRNPFGGVDTNGSANLDELWSRVSLSVHQVPHSVTHRDLPPRRRVVTVISKANQSAPTGGFAKELAAASKNGKTAILEIRLAEAASRKRAAVVERIEECVEGGQKVLVFTGRRMDCDKLVAAVKKALPSTRIYSGHGGTAAKDRDAIQQQYMADPGPCVLIGTGDAWGEGVNLQDTDTFLVVMLPFTPGQIVQWEGRVARHGQKRPVLIEYMVAEGTVDDHVSQILLTKLPAVEEVAKDDSVTGFSGALQGLGGEEELINSVFDMLTGGK